jgi:hypothetical protein
LWRVTPRQQRLKAIGCFALLAVLILENEVNREVCAHFVPKDAFCEQCRLLPCPFCGGTPDFISKTNPAAANGVAVIDCCARMEEGFIDDFYADKNADKKKAAVDRLVKNWNTRTANADVVRQR